MLFAYAIGAAMLICAIWRHEPNDEYEGDIFDDAADYRFAADCCYAGHY